MSNSQPNKKNKVYNWLICKQMCLQDCLSDLMELLLPPRRLFGQMASCLLCMARCGAQQSVCSDCLASFPTLGLACQKCCEPIVSTATDVLGDDLLCPRCQQGKRQFQVCISALQYIPPVSSMVQKLKYNGRLLYLKPLSVHLLNELDRHYADTPWPEALLPVPMHWWKLRKRSFNQAQLIAKILSKETGISLLSGYVQKLRTGSSQSRLAAKLRERNIRHSYRVKKTIALRHIAIVDDVMTTGATIDELCRVLKKDGVETIDVWCIARTPPVSHI